MKFKISPIKASDYNLEIVGDKEYMASYISSLDSSDYTTVTFYKGDDINQLAKIESGILIVNIELKTKIDSFKSRALIFSENPMLFFAEIIEINFENSFTDSQLIEKSIISNKSYIEKDVIIGDNSKIFPNVTIFKPSTIGENCVVQSGSVLGAVGMSYVKGKDMKYNKIVHLGSLEIEDDVDIGANVTILRGILEITKVGHGTKVGNNVNIGHNVVIGENCYISSGVTIGGACIIEDNCWISPGVSLSDHIHVGANSRIGVGSVIVKDVLPDSFYLGNPARKIR